MNQFLPYQPAARPPLVDNVFEGVALALGGTRLLFDVVGALRGTARQPWEKWLTLLAVLLLGAWAVSYSRRCSAHNQGQR